MVVAKIQTINVQEGNGHSNAASFARAWVAGLSVCADEGEALSEMQQIHLLTHFLLSFSDIMECVRSLEYIIANLRDRVVEEVLPSA